MSPTHTLYHFHFSVRSLFVRYTYALRGPPEDPAAQIHLDLQHIDLRPPDFQQLEENYICNISPDGEVPVLVSKQDGSILPDSRAITFRLAESYPPLIPEQHAGKIRQLLDELHEIDFYSLTFTGKYGFACGTIETLLEKRNDGNISDVYRRALDGKIEHLVSQEIPAIRRESVEYAILQTTEFLGKIDHLLQDSRSSWVLGTAQPTALDAHLICFVARLKDVARESLVPEGVLKYAERAMDGVEWKEIMDGRQTVPPAGF